jgi:hypothetical protein
VRIGGVGESPTNDVGCGVDGRTNRQIDEAVWMLRSALGMGR